MGNYAIALGVFLAAMGERHSGFLRYPGPRSMAWSSAPLWRRSERSGSGRYIEFLAEALDPLSFVLIQS